MRSALFAALLAMVAGTACHTSPDPLRDPRVLSPRGVHGDIDTPARRYSGELLALTGADFILLTDERLVVIPFVAAYAGRFGSIDVSTYGAPWGRHAEQLRYASRYPYGIPAEALTAILRSKAQSAPDTAKGLR
jgi:hypothetical protein